eukprot:172855-Amphidinium_carterae.1
MEAESVKMRIECKSIVLGCLSSNAICGQLRAPCNSLSGPGSSVPSQEPLAAGSLADLLLTMVQRWRTRAFHNFHRHTI